MKKLSLAVVFPVGGLAVVFPVGGLAVVSPEQSRGLSRDLADVFNFPEKTFPCGSHNDQYFIVSYQRIRFQQIKKSDMRSGLLIFYFFLI
jgi:hypothetical protein